MVAAALRGGGGQSRSGALRIDDLVQDLDLDRPLQSTAEHLVLCCQFILYLCAVLFCDLREAATVQDTHGCNRTHDGHGGCGPGEHLGGTHGPGVHCQVGTPIGLACHEGDAGDRGLGKGVQQLGAAPRRTTSSHSWSTPGR
jgi:hypothetical protein